LLKFVVAGLSAISGVGATATGAASEKENWREGIVPKPIREVVLQLREKLKENKKLTEEFTAASGDGTIKVKEYLKEFLIIDHLKVEHKLCEVYSKTVECDMKCVQLNARIAKDVQLGDIAQRVQESVNKNVHLSSYSQIIQYIVDIIREYDDAVICYQDTIEDIEAKLNALLNGKGTMTVSSLKELLTRFDTAFSRVATKLFDASNALNRRADTSRLQSFNTLRGNDFVPSQSAIAELGKQLKPAAGAAPATGTGLFGSTTSSSLFGSGATTTKPFSFATTSSGGTSLFPSLSSSTTGPLFSSLTSTTANAPKPALCFGSTITNNSSGLLFSSKK
uniref:Nucleoporin p58/p45 n=1 Tax=Angiostrongylus cantonensis TaxID=6313 RepID=A0A0K0CTK0_ANGCA